MATVITDPGKSPRQLGTLAGAATVGSGVGSGVGVGVGSMIGTVVVIEVIAVTAGGRSMWATDVDGVGVGGGPMRATDVDDVVVDGVMSTFDASDRDAVRTKKAAATMAERATRHDRLCR